MSKWSGIPKRPIATRYPTARRVIRPAVLSIPVIRAQIHQPSVVTTNVETVTPASLVPNRITLGKGLGFSMSDKMEFTTLCMQGLLKGSKETVLRTYDTQEGRMKKIRNMVPKVGAEFAAKLALTLRIQHGERSISHLLAACVAQICSGEPWAADFFSQIVVRADDMREILAAIWAYNGVPRKNQTTPGVVKKKVPNAVKKGFAQAFGRLDYYRIAKYGNKEGSPSLRDIALLVHPTWNEKNKEGMQDLLSKKLKNVDTWEAQLSAGGQSGESKGVTWGKMVVSGKMGQLGLLKNLRNIAEHCDESIVDVAIEQLTDKAAIAKNGILPAQYVKAYKVLEEMTSLYKDKLRAGIDDAVEIAAGNVPQIGKKVLVAIDHSASMKKVERDAAALFAATLLKSNPNADVIYFAENARYETFNRKLPLLTLMEDIRKRMGTGSTNFHAIFQTANKAYDTIVILSDNEGWMGGPGHIGQNSGAPTESLKAYQRTHNIIPTIFSFDLAGDGHLMFREDSIITLAGASFATFKMLNLLKQERKMLVDIIDRIEIGQKLPSLEVDDEE